MFQGKIITKLQIYINEILKKTSSPEGQIQPNFPQSILGYRKFKFAQMEGPPFYQEEIITNKQKYIDERKWAYNIRSLQEQPTRNIPCLFNSMFSQHDSKYIYLHALSLITKMLSENDYSTS